MKKFFFSIAYIALISLSITANVRAANYHSVGWFNTFVPGGGEFLLGHPIYGAVQAGLEIGTFYAGYKRSPKAPITLDGVPADLPPPQGPRYVQKTSTRWVCVWNAVLNKCNWKKETLGVRTMVNSQSNIDISTSLYATWLQEFGIKYHFVNVFNAYRAAARNSGGGTIHGQRIDKTSTGALFLAPFNPKNFLDPTVGTALLISAAALVYNYQSLVTSGGIPSTARLNQRSMNLYNFTYLAVFPTGSAVPEEMFYRGFLQHEFYSAVASPYFAIPLSSTAYAFSHSSDERPSAAITGIFLGLLTYWDKGALSRAITYHFWANIFAGIYQISLVKKGMGERPLIDISLKF